MRFCHSMISRRKKLWWMPWTECIVFSRNSLQILFLNRMKKKIYGFLCFFFYIFWPWGKKENQFFFIQAPSPPSWVRGREGEGRWGFLLFNFCFAAKIDFLALGQKSQLKSKLFSFIKEKRRESKSNEKKIYFFFQRPLSLLPPP